MLNKPPFSVLLEGTAPSSVPVRAVLQLSEAADEDKRVVELQYSVSLLSAVQFDAEVKRRNLGRTRSSRVGFEDDRLWSRERFAFVTQEQEF